MPTFREQVETIIALRDRYENATDKILSLVHALVDETIPDSGHNTPIAERNVRRAIIQGPSERLGTDRPVTGEHQCPSAGAMRAE